MGALTQLYAGTMPEAASLGGKASPRAYYLLYDILTLRTVSQYLNPWARLGEPTKAALDDEAGKKLWSWFEEQVENQ